MKSPLLAVLILTLAACAHVDVIYRDVVRVRDMSRVSLAGLYRYPDAFWQTTLELRSDYTFRYEQMTDTFEHTVIDGTWIRDGDRLKLDSSAPQGGTVYHLLVRSGSRIGLLKETSLAQLRKDDALRAVHAQTCWREEKPNKALEPTRTSGTSAAELPRVPAARVAHL